VVWPWHKCTMISLILKAKWNYNKLMFERITVWLSADAQNQAC
jgi:hypothetical protein